MILAGLLAIAVAAGLAVDLELMFEPWLRFPTGLLLLAFAPVTFLLRTGGELLAPFLAGMMAVGGVIVLIGNRDLLEREGALLVLVLGLMLTGMTLVWRARS